VLRAENPTSSKYSGICRRGICRRGKARRGKARQSRQLTHYTARFEHRGEGDLHETKFDQYARTNDITGVGIFSDTSASYTLVLYPSVEFFTVYSTPNPWIATIGAVCIIFLCTLFFFLYDSCVRTEFNAKKDLLEAKRMFVRFVSHEVRTPLNTVCMGLTLLQEEMGTALGCPAPSTDCVPASHEEQQQRQLKLKSVSAEDANEWQKLSQEILNNAQASVDVLDDLLNYDKVLMGTLSLELSLLPIWDLLEHTVSEFKLSALEQKVKLSVNFGKIAASATNDDESPCISAKMLPQDVLSSIVIGDSVRISQVLRNLVSNGLKFTPENGKESVTLRYESSDNSYLSIGLTIGQHSSFQNQGALQ
jgi:hypothetical protein